MTVTANRWKILLLFIFATVGAFALYYLKTFDPFEMMSFSDGKVTFAFYIFATLSVLTFFAVIFSKSLRAQLNHEGLYVPSVSAKVIPWADIENIGIQKNQGVKFVVFNLKKGSPSKRSVKFFKRFEYIVGRVFGIGGYTINVATSNVSAEEFIACFHEHYKQYSSASLLAETLDKMRQTGELQDLMQAEIAKREAGQHQPATSQNRYSTVKPSAVTSTFSAVATSKPKPSFGQRNS